MTRVRTGLENFLANPPDWATRARLGLLCNPASVDRDLTPAAVRIARRLPGRLRALYAPQHGYRAEKQDNMVESPDMHDPLLDLPVFSLYGETRRPTGRMLAPIDTMLVDLQDVGTRVYTFIYTMSYCLEAARELGLRVAILDRPNPVGGRLLEGNVLEKDFRSFVGRFPLPMRHGLTMGELALLFNEHHAIGCRLEVIPMVGWRREMAFEDTGLPWVAPSPNLPTPRAAQVYPGQVVWEGTNLSEGRGTSQPFELCGAPWLDPERILDLVGGRRQPGALLRPAVFEPTSGKWSGRPCRGFQIHVTDPQAYRPYRTTLAILAAVIRCHSGDFAWKAPPYEYEYERLPADLILGSGGLRRGLADGRDPAEMEAEWREGLEAFRRISRRYRMYR